MKKLLSLILCAITLVGAPVVFTGCKSAEHSAYVAAGSVFATADAAIGAYNDYRKTHDVPKSQVIEVRRAVKAYVEAVSAAREATNAWKTGQGSKDAVDILLDAVTAASANVIQLVQIIIQK